MTPGEFRDLRRALYMTQEELGGAMGVTQTTIARKETDAVKVTRVDALALEALLWRNDMAAQAKALIERNG